MAGGTDWRYACVTRAQTIASGLRMIDLAIDGRLPRLTSAARADFVVAVDGAHAIRTFDCIPAPHGRVRVMVHAGEDAGRRFMWSLVEGATVRMALVGLQTRLPAPDARPAPHFDFLDVCEPIIVHAERDASAGAIRRRALAANSSTV